MAIWKSIDSILKYAWAAHILFGRHSEITWINHGPKSASYPESPELVKFTYGLDLRNPKKIGAKIDLFVFLRPKLI